MSSRSGAPPSEYTNRRSKRSMPFGVRSCSGDSCTGVNSAPSDRVVSAMARSRSGAIRPVTNMSPSIARARRVVTIAPRPADNMCGSACLQPSIGPRRLTVMVRSHTSTSIVTTSASRWMMTTSAALLWSSCTEPYRSTAAATMAATDASSLTSASWAEAVPPRAVIRSTVSAAPSGLMSATTTRTPSVASRSALARPMPEPDPVTIATLPSSPCTRPPSRLRRRPRVTGAAHPRDADRRAL